MKNNKKCLFPSFKANYSTPFGERWLTIYASNERFAKMLAENKVSLGLWKKGWSLKNVEPSKTK